MRKVPEQRKFYGERMCHAKLIQQRGRIMETVINASSLIISSKSLQIITSDN
jgi:hypothetical protein